jgi:hypothetical protein
MHDGVQFFDVTSSLGASTEGLYWSRDGLHYLHQLGGTHAIEGDGYSIALDDLRLRPLRHGREELKHTGQPMFEGMGADGRPMFLFFSHKITQVGDTLRGVWLVDYVVPPSPMSLAEFELRKSQVIWFADAVYDRRDRSKTMRAGLPFGKRRGGELEGKLMKVDTRWVLKESEVGFVLDECVNDGRTVPSEWPKIRVRAKEGRAFDSYKVSVYWDTDSRATWLDRD